MHSSQRNATIGRSYSVPATQQQNGARLQSNQLNPRRPSSPHDSILSASDYQVLHAKCSTRFTRKNATYTIPFQNMKPHDILGVSRRKSYVIYLSNISIEKS